MIKFFRFSKYLFFFGFCVQVLCSFSVFCDQSIDSVIEFWDRRPCNIRHSAASFGSKQYFDEVEERKYFVESHIPNFADFSKWKNKRVLEIGCGIGTDAINFARAGAEVTVVECSSKSLEIAKKRFEVFGLKAEFVLIDAERLSEALPFRSFDLVYSFGVIHHTPHPDKVIEEIEKVIKLKGELRIMLYAKYSTKNFMIHLGLAQPEAQTGCPIAFTYTKQEILELLSRFHVYDCHKDHIFPYRVADYKEYRYIKKFPWNICPKFLFRQIEKYFGWHYLIKAKYDPIFVDGK